MREVSFKILYDIFFNNALLNISINKYFDDEALSIKDDDKSFIKREVTGVIEKLEEIDEKIDKFSKIKAKKLDRDILIVLRLGIYEMTYMDKVPSYATVSECVDIIKKSKNAKLSGYVNAVLRNYARNNATKVETFSDKVKKNCYFRIYNDQEDIVLSELIDKKIKYERYSGALDFKKAKVYKVDKYRDIIDTDSFGKGYVLIEDASSIYMTEKLCEYLLSSKSDDVIRLIDTCAAPGGKTLGVVDLLKKEYKIVDAIACDVSADKIAKINENIIRLKVSEIKALVKDATMHDKSYDDSFDLVICDVPCTGLGVIEKKPDIKLNYSDDKRDLLVKIQRDILDVSKNYVKSGGILSYSTCTETYEENEANINYFLEKNNNYKKIYEKKISRKDEHNADGFYMCFMKKD